MAVGPLGGNRIFILIFIRILTRIRYLRERRVAVAYLSPLADAARGIGECGEEVGTLEIPDEGDWGVGLGFRVNRQVIAMYIPEGGNVACDGSANEVSPGGALKIPVRGGRIGETWQQAGHRNKYTRGRERGLSLVPARRTSRGGQSPEMPKGGRVGFGLRACLI